MDIKDKNIGIIINSRGDFGKTESYNRSQHNDFATSKELKDNGFTGMRENSITESFEIWVDGEMGGSMSKAYAAANPAKFEQLYKDVFMLL